MTEIKIVAKSISYLYWPPTYNYNDLYKPPLVIDDQGKNVLLYQECSRFVIPRFELSSKDKNDLNNQIFERIEILALAYKKVHLSEDFYIIVDICGDYILSSSDGLIYVAYLAMAAIEISEHTESKIPYNGLCFSIPDKIKI